MNRRWDETARLFVSLIRAELAYPVRNLGYEEQAVVEVGNAVMVSESVSACSAPGAIARTTSRS